MINEKTLKKLQYHDILQQVAAYSISSVAKQKVLDLLPADSFEETVRLVNESKQAYDLFQFESSFDLSVDDIKDACALARVGSCLSMGQCLQVMRTLRTARNLQTALFVDYGVDTSMLRAIACRLFADKTLEDDVDFAILSEDEMNDKASADLFAIRKKIRAINADIKNKLQSYTKNGETAKYMQDAIVTMRGDRYVIPVKAEYKGYVNGIVHDQSATGATLFIEPMAIVQLNNSLREAILEEKAEIQRILQAFTDRISPFAARIVDSQDAVADIDVIFSKTKYAIDNKCTLPVVNKDGYINLKKARHPLLDKQKVVPVSVKMGRDYDIIVITGPNTGGKTVTLKTVGLITTLAMTGIFVPCSEESAVSYFDDIYCDIGDEQSIEQNLSTFSGHITNLRDILNVCGKGSLVLIDEVGAGTEPNEGTALALAVTDFLRKSGAKAVITTHYEKLKEYSLATDRVQNASMEFDLNTLAPTYRLIMGVPGSSNALAIASKLGMRSDVIEFAKQNVSSEKLEFENALNRADEIRKDYESKLSDLEQQQKSLQAELDRQRKLNDSLQSERDKLLEGSRKEAEKIVDKAREEAQDIVAELKDILNKETVTDKDLFQARSAAKKIGEIKLPEQDTSDEIVFTGEKADYLTMKAGDSLYSQKLKTQVKVEQIKSPTKITVRAGNITTVVTADDLYYSIVEKNKHTVKNRQPRSAAHTQINTERSARNEINVIGQTVDEAIVNVDAFIDQAVINGLGKLWVIHGMGTGRLRAGLHNHFRHHPNIKEFRLGAYGEGESGVTVVTLK